METKFNKEIIRYVLVRENLLLENFEQRCGVILLLPAVLKIDCEEEWKIKSTYDIKAEIQERLDVLDQAGSSGDGRIQFDSGYVLNTK